MPEARDPYARIGVERIPLHDGAGDVVVVVTPAERRGRPWADLVWVPRPTAARPAAAALLETFAGAYASLGDPAVVATLQAEGATVVRHAHGYSRDLGADPPPAEWLDDPATPPGAVLEQLTEDRGHAEAPAIADCRAAAFSAGHPDRDDADRETRVGSLAKILAGEVMGPLLPGASLARDRAGQVVGALVLTDRPGVAPYAGPWVIDVFRDPDPCWSGLGAALLRVALARSAADGLVSVGLVVSDANPARSLYERFGFRHVDEAWTLDLPGLPTES